MLLNYIKLFLLIVLCTSIFIIILLIINPLSKTVFSYILNNSTFYLNNILSNRSCKQNNNGIKQFSVLIDGVIYPKVVPLYYNKSIDFKLLQKSKKRHRILLWNRYWKTLDYYYGLGNVTPFANNQCPVTNCELTYNQDLVNESDFVILHMMIDYDFEKPKRASSKQYWIFYGNESPLHSINNLTKYNNFFNFSSTYRSDSMTTSIYYAESSFYWQLNNNFNENSNFLLGKDRFAATVITNCKDKADRISFVEKLQKYIQVSFYGGCGFLCPTVECHEYIATKYKFYFAFENSFCKDYITEKFFGILKHNIIPVVLGAGPYDRYVPKSGFINALDYETPEQLAKYLIYLSNNATAYNSYFKWKKYVVFDKYRPYLGHICEWCILLNLNEYKRINDDPRIKDINKFWNPAIDCKWPNSSNGSLFSFRKMTEREGRKKQLPWYN